MNQLTPIEYSGQRILTTSQLAGSYGTSSERISKNYHENKSRFKEGKHFFKLEGEELLHFRNSEPQIDISNMTRVLYLWTKKGSWLHAKSLNTDEAWDAYEVLVDDYYEKLEKQPVQMTQSELIAYLAQQNVERERAEAEQNKRIAAVEKRVDDTVEILALNPTEWRKKTTNLLGKIAHARGGTNEVFQAVRNESYDLLEQRASCRLNVQLTNRKRKMALEGATKSKIDKTSKLDCIADNARLTEIYLAIVKEMAIRNRVILEEGME